jgi:hypothetical protein
LQSADALIFFSIPWRPEDVDQWIGRVDRLGRGFVAPEMRKSPPKPLKIITINRYGDPTLALERVFDEYRILESAVDIEAELADQISARIGNAVFDANGGADEECPQLRLNREVLPPTGSTWSVQNAVETHSEMVFGDALEPQLRHTKPLGLVSNAQEQCLASWVTLLADHEQIATRKVSKKFTDGSRRGDIWTLSQLHCTGVSLQSLQGRSQSFPAFFIARRNIYSPPRLYAVTGKTHEGNDRQVLLQFLSHGSPLHEELVKSYREAGRTTTALGITLFAIGPRYFPKGTMLKPGNYPVGVGFIDAAVVYQYVSPRSLLADSFGGETGSRRTSMRDSQVLHFQAGVEADQRFVRMVASTKSCCLAFSSDGKPCSDRDSADLLTAHWSHDERPNTISNPVSDKLRDGLPMHFRLAIAAEMRRFWGESIEQTEELIEERIEMIRIETFNSVWNLRSAMDEVRKQIEELESFPSEQNDQTIRMTYRPRLSLLEEELRVVEFACKSRCELLEKSLSHLKSPSTETVELQAIAVIGLQKDPVPIPVQQPNEEADDEAHSAASEFQTLSTPSGDDVATKPNKPR